MPLMTCAHVRAGDLPGDFGFDPLKLGEDPEALKWYAQAELQNGRCGPSRLATYSQHAWACAVPKVNCPKTHRVVPLLCAMQGA
jgi:hypothetical protein